MVKFLHVADLHLGMRITRFDERACAKIREARYEALEQLRDQAVKHQVQFLLVAGDLFDDHSVSQADSLRAFTIFEGKSFTCPVYVIPGNHDPLTLGGVWERDPWKREQPTKHIRLLRESAPVAVPGLPVTLFPCPLKGRNSIHDPTAWIADHPRAEGDDTVRIGLAHGSLAFLPNLPEDDHLIRPDAAEHLGLDYLALGHWHTTLQHASRGGAARTAYPGTPEPMRFPDATAVASTGWASRSGDGDADRFRDDGRGTALLIAIEGAGAPPQITTLEVGRLRWVSDRVDLTSKSIGEIISAYAERPERALTILRLSLSGVVAPEKHARLDDALKGIINRYGPGSSYHADAVLGEPSPEQLERVVGDGVLARVLTRLREESRSTDPAEKRVADLAVRLLYQIAWEGQPG